MHLDSGLPILVSVLFGILVISFTLQKFHQLHVVDYLVAGILPGSYVFAVVEDKDPIGRLGNISIVLLLFLIGMEFLPKRLVSSWGVSVVGTLLWRLR